MGNASCMHWLCTPFMIVNSVMFVPDNFKCKFSSWDISQCKMATSKVVTNSKRLRQATLFDIPNKSSNTSKCSSLCCGDNNKPYQPRNRAILPTMANSGRNFVERWYNSYPWLPRSLCTTKKKAYCFYCRNAVQQGLLTFSSKAEEAFSRNGFNNWRKALENFEVHAHSLARGEATMKWQMLQSSPQSVGEQLSSQLQKD